MRNPALRDQGDTTISRFEREFGVRQAITTNPQNSFVAVDRRNSIRRCLRNGSRIGQNRPYQVRIKVALDGRLQLIPDQRADASDWRSCLAGSDSERKQSVQRLVRERHYSGSSIGILGANPPDVITETLEQRFPP